MLNIQQFRANIVRPTLEAIGAHSRAAEDLVLGTALQESNLHYLRQLNEGPARGVYQMEPATYDDIWENYLAFRAELSTRVSAFLVPERDHVGCGGQGTCCRFRDWGLWGSRCSSTSERWGLSASGEERAKEQARQAARGGGR